MNNIQHHNCSGCGGCEALCPAGCISIGQDSMGFFRAFVDEEKCLNCGMCLKYCSLRTVRKEGGPLAAFAACNRDEQVRGASSSGGIFTALAEKVLEQGGAVFGGAFDEKMQVRHLRAETKEQLAALRGSKYVQSDLRGVFRQVKAILDAGRTVLFVGTPCQVAGLYTAVGRHENLLTCDLVCHGAPSPALFAGYLARLEKKYGKITGYNFRSKERANARMSYTVKLTAGGKNIYLSGDEEPYTMRFISGALQMSCCYDCPYTSESRVGDVTLADYWGYEQAHPQLQDRIGVSLILVNSEKGRKLLQTAEGIELIPTTREKYLVKNTHLAAPGKKHPDRDGLYEAFAQSGFTGRFYEKHFLPKGYRMYIFKCRIRSMLK